MEKIPTAEEVALQIEDIASYEELKNPIVFASLVAIEFARLHVEEALKEALESIPCLGSSTDIATYEEVEEAVLNAYPLENIK